MRQFLACITTLIIGLTVLPNAEDSLTQPFRLEGRVTDGGSPIVGATVVLVFGDSVLVGAATDEDGSYTIFGLVEYDRPLALRVRAVGFATNEIDITVGPQVKLPDIWLRETPLDVGTVRVVGSKEKTSVSSSIERSEVLRSARQSFVPTNPVAALKSPEVVRQGSNHSSQIRIDGAAPEFLIDGASVGTDPDHYGMFAVLPTPAVQAIQLQSRGTAAGHRGPAVVEIETPRTYAFPLSGELNLSIIEATGAIAYGTENQYALATVRKSVLDQLVNNIDIRAGRRTIPPAGFTDLFLSVGARFGQGREIIVNQYHAADRLVFDTGPSKIAPNGVSTFQDTEEHFISGRYKGLHGDFLVELNTGVHLREEKYVASSLSEPSSLDIDLAEQMAELNAGIRVTSDWRGRSIKVGYETEAVIDRNTSLSQQNWNFLPPNATSDSPHPYQPELNKYYGEVAYSQSNLEHAACLSIQHEYGPLALENGVRLQANSGVASSPELLQRHRATYTISKQTAVTLFAGTFSESPISRVLEPYQVLIRLDHDLLQPVRTELVSLGGRYKFLSGSLFARRTSHLPVLEPDFSTLNQVESPTLDERGLIYFGPAHLSSGDFLSMRSVGEATHFGCEIAMSPIQVFDPRITVNGSYAYTHARNITPAASYPADLDSPHRLYSGVTVAVTNKLSIGTEFSLRSGYPYTPYPSTPANSNPDRFNTTYYSQQQSSVNSERFPVNYQINFNLNYDFGGSQLFFNVANLTNRGNPVINTNSGYVYDAGILPSVGYRLTF